jgi:hypothetical protein
MCGDTLHNLRTQLLDVCKQNKFGSDVAFKNSYVWVCSEAQLLAALKKQQPLFKKTVHKLSPLFEDDIPVLVLNVEKENQRCGNLETCRN